MDGETLTVSLKSQFNKLIVFMPMFTQDWFVLDIKFVLAMHDLEMIRCEKFCGVDCRQFLIPPRPLSLH